jgi:poly-gamma-glutamate capsule biosynthesis protein CapA/YwtB (metallophosphatase superfamily)
VFRKAILEHRIKSRMVTPLQRENTKVETIMVRQPSFFLFILAGLVAIAQAQNEQPASKTIDLAFAGDIMLADTPGERIALGEDPFGEFAEVFRKVDLALGNLECVVSTTGKPFDKPYVYRAHPRVLELVQKHLDIVCLANNHTGDFGHYAFLDQLRLLEQKKIRYVGGGRDCAHARQPLIVDLNGLRVAFLAYNDFQPRAFEAGPSWPGVAWAVDEQVTADIAAARTIHQADFVIPILHWGWEYEPANDRQRQLAKLMIDAGADLIVGGHPHVTQEVEYYKGKLIIFSIGNFIFDGFDPGPSRIGWILRTRIGKQQLIAWDTLVAEIDDRGLPSLKVDSPSPAGTTADAPIIQRCGMKDSVFK